MRIFWLMVMALGLPFGFGNAGDSSVGLISWGTWAQLTPGGKPLSVSYYNLLSGSDANRDGVELWFDANVGGTDNVIGLTGPSLDRLERNQPRFSASIIRGYDVNLMGRSSPIISRSQSARLRDGRVIVVAAIGPQYGAGGKLTELFPAIFTSPTGKPDTWTHLGPPAGEPLKELAAHRSGKLAFRFEGGSLFERADGSLALYCGWNPGQPGGARLALLTAPSATGAWTFKRNGNGAIADLADQLPKSGWLFPAVYGLGARGLLLAGGNAWPPTRIDAAISHDGVTFAPLPPLITAPTQVLAGASSIKSVRLLYRPDHDDVVAIANPHQRGSSVDLMYPLYWTVGTFTTPKPPAGKPATPAQK